MKITRLSMYSLLGFSFLVLLTACTGNQATEEGSRENKPGNFKMGWASADITPDGPVLLCGQFHARVSEGVMDRVTATALAIESVDGTSSRKAILISCDLVGISDGTLDGSGNNLRDLVRNLLVASLPSFNPEEIILNATHTHTAPECSPADDPQGIYGVELDVMAPAAYQQFASEQIAKAAERAWRNRKPAGISFGLGHAVVGHNRLQVDFTGNSRMYGNTDRSEFSHMEGYEDHAVNLLYTWDKQKNLTGVVINLACPSQATENEYLISADFWHDTRQMIHQRLGEDVYVLPQCSAAGDQSPHIMVGSRGEERMQRIMGPDNIETGRQKMGRRKQIAVYIADAVTSVLPYMKDTMDWDPVFDRRMERVQLPRRLIGKDDVDQALEEAKRWEEQYKQRLIEAEKDPRLKEDPRWYRDISVAYRLMKRGQSVQDRFELEKVQPSLAVEVHVLRIGDIVMATNPFELYLDYGVRMKARSPAVQTFLVQLAGSGTYLPTARSVAGGAYGAVPASTLIGPEGGQELVEATLDLINELWQNNHKGS
jgi:hypothetical protein